MPETEIRLIRRVQVVILSWLAAVAVDFLLHGGILARFYLEESPFLLKPQDAFALIPLGYAAFLVLAVLTVWLLEKLGIRDGRSGFIFGLKLGVLIWSALILGMLSITTAPWPLMACWFVGQSLEMGVGGAVAGSGLGSVKLGKLTGLVVLLLVLCIMVTVAMQSTGLVPTLKM